MIVLEEIEVDTQGCRKDDRFLGKAPILLAEVQHEIVRIGQVLLGKTAPLLGDHRDLVPRLVKDGKGPQPPNGAFDGSKYIASFVSQIITFVDQAETPMHTAKPNTIWRNHRHIGKQEKKVSRQFKRNVIATLDIDLDIQGPMGTQENTNQGIDETVAFFVDKTNLAAAAVLDEVLVGLFPIDQDFPPMDRVLLDEELFLIAQQ